MRRHASGCGAAATARRSIARGCLRSSVVLLLRRSVVLLLRRARSCCDAAQRDCFALMKLTRSQRCATRSVATIEWCGPGEQQELRFYAENAVLWANQRQVQPAPSFFRVAKRVFVPARGGIPKRRASAAERSLRRYYLAPSISRCEAWLRWAALPCDWAASRAKAASPASSLYALVWAARIGLGCDQARRSRLSCRNCSW